MFEQKSCFLPSRNENLNKSSSNNDVMTVPPTSYDTQPGGRSMVMGFMIVRAVVSEELKQTHSRAKKTLLCSLDKAAQPVSPCRVVS